MICKEKNQTYYLNQEKTFEHTVTEIVYPNYSITVACIYRSPDGCIETYLENFEILLNSLKSKGKPLILCRDFNINFLNNDSIVSEFRTIIHSHNLAETIHTPTRVTLNSQTCLDQIIIDQDLNPFKKDNMNMGISDHHAIFLYKHFNTKLIEKNLTKYKRLFNDENIEYFKFMLQKENWNNVLELNEPDVDGKSLSIHIIKQSPPPRLSVCLLTKKLENY